MHKTLTETFRLCIIMGTLLTAGDLRSLTANLIGVVCLAPYFLLRTCPLLLSLWGIAFVFLIEAQRASVEMHLHRLHLSVWCAGDDRLCEIWTGVRSSFYFINQGQAFNIICATIQVVVHRPNYAERYHSENHSDPIRL